MSKKKKKRKVIDNFIWSVAEILRGGCGQKPGHILGL